MKEPRKTLYELVNRQLRREVALGSYMQIEIGQMVGVKTSVVNSWLSGIAYPTMLNYIKLRGIYPNLSEVPVLLAKRAHEDILASRKSQKYNAKLYGLHITTIKKLKQTALYGWQMRVLEALWQYYSECEPNEWRFCDEDNSR